MDLQSLLFKFLDEFVYLLSGDNFIVKRVKIISMVITDDCLYSLVAHWYFKLSILLMLYNAL